MIKTFFITIMDNPRSLQVAKRGVKSAQYYGINDAITWKATVPKDDPDAILDSKSIGKEGFDENYARRAPLIASFCSHLSLWEYSIELNESIIVCEHDAVFTGTLPPSLNSQVTHVCNIGHPSYGKWVTPAFGIGKLVSKQYFPGAHAYVVTPTGAKGLINGAKALGGEPNDLFINNKRFPWLQELYPWVAEVKDTFTTIQKTKGCLAKHGYSETYDII
jgi:GR25 family glycosyltransferase involved in LPS biosynthesis|tara:strand:+ start:756 stop:1412 length:657 start_codon:yes stop_codon:yes gene_type:complete